MVSYRSAKFGGHGCQGSGDILLVWHMISPNHVIKEFCELTGGSPSW